MLSRIPAGAPGPRRVAARPVAAALACTAIALAGCSTAATSSTTSGSSPASGGQSAAAGGGTSATSALAAVATHASKITSYTATFTNTSTGAHVSSLNGSVAVQIKPLLADEKFSFSSSQMPLGGMEMILTGNVIYMKMSLLSRMVGKPWIKLDFASLKNTTGLDLGSMFQQIQANNPLADAQMFAASTNVHKTGTAVINGVPVTVYTGTYNIASGLSRLDPSMRQALGGALSSMGATTSHFTVWVDFQHNVRKVVQTEQVNGGTVTTSILVTSINQPLNVHAPPASQVAVGLPGL